MAFDNYQASKYITYLEDHERNLKAIYKLIKDSIITTTQLGVYLGYDYYATARKIKLKRFTNDELIQILKIIK